jgi:hypothetical protein
MLDAALADLESARVPGVDTARRRCFGTVYTTSTESIGEAGLALEELLRGRWAVMPDTGRRRVLACLRRIAGVWPCFWWVWLRYRIWLALGLS